MQPSLVLGNSSDFYRREFLSYVIAENTKSNVKPLLACSIVRAETSHETLNIDECRVQGRDRGNV